MREAAPPRPAADRDGAILEPPEPGVGPRGWLDRKAYAMASSPTEQERTESARGYAVLVEKIAD